MLPLSGRRIHVRAREGLLRPNSESIINADQAARRPPERGLVASHGQNTETKTPPPQYTTRKWVMPRLQEARQDSFGWWRFLGERFCPQPVSRNFPACIKGDIWGLGQWLTWLPVP
ncbi:hypothetical protein G0U57_013678 [Chelydra serpentina]|uniref:Uncharacterized protein n=1 Tax=Chelydra serpentina TaxID=8475 RepID=A0A8T1SAE8_CHESE|nr:hypothetical protein G0U57_013678 [Chelydra serpentina]